MAGGGMHVWGVCMVGGGMCDERGMYGKGGCMVEGGHVWQRGGMHGKGGGGHGEGGQAWQKGVHVWRKGEACVVCMPPPAFYKVRPVNARAVRILLECILVF